MSIDSVDDFDQKRSLNDVGGENMFGMLDYRAHKLYSFFMLSFFLSALDPRHLAPSFFALDNLLVP